MSNKWKLIRVYAEDVELMRTVSKELFLSAKNNKNMRGIYLTDAFLFKKIIEFYNK